jgi:3-hydroxyisobutyrate dehydrogenase-like beta-hydroxyacid dehydrogenase
MSTRIAILGTGKMGSAFARRLSGAGTDLGLTLWNRTRERAQELGVGRIAPTPADAVRDADLVITSLTNEDALRAAYLGSDGALTAASGQLFVEMSTTGPDVVTAMAPLVEATGSALIDAPVLGAPTVAARGGLAILVGGIRVDVERARPVLELLGEVRHVGPLGAGARLKLAANSMLANIILAAAELQTAGCAAGLDPDDVFWVLARFVPSLELRRAGYLEDRHEPALFALRDLLKDLDLAVELFHRSSAPVPLTALTRELVAEATRGAAGLDITAIIRRYRSVAPPEPRGPGDAGAIEPALTGGC